VSRCRYFVRVSYVRLVLFCIDDVVCGVFSLVRMSYVIVNVVRFGFLFVFSAFWG
jgi:hypothetical protein